MWSVASSQHVRKAKKGCGVGGARQGDMRLSREVCHFLVMAMPWLRKQSA